MREIRVRATQQFSKLGERFLRLSQGEMSDRAFLANVKRSVKDHSPEAIAASIFERAYCSPHVTPGSTSHSFFQSLRDRECIIDAMMHSFPSERLQIIETAERAIKGQFDLLGFKDLSFGKPTDWHLEPISGKRSPLHHWSRINYLKQDIAGDKKVTWELNRHQHFVTLGQAYWITGNERFSEAFVTQAASWMDANPPKLGINWASSLELAFRSIAWLWAIHLFAGSPCLTSAFKLRLLKYLLAHGFHLESYLSHYFSPNTHLTGEALGLFYIGASLPELNRAEKWKQLGLNVLIEQLKRQVRSEQRAMRAAA